MVFPVTCSSVGDIIAVASLALKIAQILSHSTGASYEYQCLIEELRLLGQTLQHTHAVGQLLPLNVDVMNSLRSQVAQCKDLMDKFMARIEGYRKRLGGDVSGFSATWRKIGWGLFKTEEVTDLRSKLSTHRTMLVLFLTIGNTTGISSLIDYASEARQHHQSIQIKLAEIYTALRQLPPTIGHSLANSIYFVDALGSRMMLPIQLVSSWDKFETILKFHFQDRVGRWHVERDQYVIISDTGSGVIDSATWADSIKAGTILEMCVLLGRNEFGKRNQCPRCGRLNSEDSIEDGDWTECLSCDARYRDTDDGDSDEHPQDSYASAPVESRSSRARPRVLPEIVITGTGSNPEPSTVKGIQPLDDARFFRSFYILSRDWWFKARAGSDYSPEDPQELSLRKDEVVLVLLARGTWWTVRNEDGAVGVVPSSSLLPVIGRASLHSLQAVACFDYVAASEDEISFCGGDILNVCNFQDEWWEVYKANGDTGMAPSNYLRLWWADKQSYFRGSAVAELSPREMPSASTATFPRASSLFKAQASFAYPATDGEELSFAKDDILDIWDINDKWWMASNSDGKRGIVPLNYLAPLSSEAENIKVKAQYAYTAAQPDDVSLSTGEILEIIYFRNDGWWKVKKGDGTEGLAPSNFLSTADP